MQGGPAGPAAEEWVAEDSALDVAAALAVEGSLEAMSIWYDSAEESNREKTNGDNLEMDLPYAYIQCETCSRNH